ncbi:DUF3293 domain-containing protein [Mycolicibacterium mengxianglii]|uniref:DUF3293 domain-containing protein n=1 Tax=Mycolicibacterium mengxianglii TaxID=2736649 RepID=UPI0018D10FC6|nr:DUF3293 domain-containing protein [Mycolicibacterium mengxianglii]
MYDDFEWTAMDKLVLLAGCDTPWRYYEQTAVQFDAPGSGGRVVPVTDHENDDEAPPLGPLHVVSAVQPNGDPGSSDSAARLELLDHQLFTQNVRAIRAVGSSLGGDHAEECRAVFGLSDQQARELGLRFGQVAVFAWNGPRWSLLSCATDRQTHRGWKWMAAD